MRRNWFICINSWAKRYFRHHIEKNMSTFQFCTEMRTAVEYCKEMRRCTALHLAQHYLLQWELQLVWADEIKSNARTFRWLDLVANPSARTFSWPHARVWSVLIQTNISTLWIKEIVLKVFSVLFCDFGCEHDKSYCRIRFNFTYLGLFKSRRWMPPHVRPGG